MMTPERKENTAASDYPVDQLINLLGDADPQVRAQARHRLSARAEEAIPELVQAMQAEGERTRFEVSKALTEMGEAAVRPMLEAIQHPNARVREVAARVLSLIGGEHAQKHLDEVARREKRKTVRKELREAAAKIGRRLESISAKSEAHSALGDARPHGQEGLSDKEREEKRLYFSIVRNLILSNWTRPRPFSAEAEPDEALVTLKLDRDGGLSRVLMENKWQDSPLGESLKGAIRRSAPFPPVPEGVARGKREIEITFILPVPS